MHFRMRTLLGASLAVAVLGLPSAGVGQDRTLPLELTVAQSAPADFVGADEVALQAALDRLGEAGGGTLLIAPGRYLIRNTLRVPANTRIEGTPRTVLALPRPARLLAPAPAGSRELWIDTPDDLAPGTWLELLPAEADWPTGTPIADRVARVTTLTGQRIGLERSTSLDLPLGARVGVSQKMLWVNSVDDVVIERLTFDGGRVASIPMPGHQKRTAVWLSSHFTHAEGPKVDPVRNVTVQHCVFRNCYGRGVALYNVVESSVIGCSFEDIADEAIDFDHFTYRCSALGNSIERAVFGITINDGSDNQVRFNRIRACATGVTIWRLDSVIDEDVNRRNHVANNRFSACSEYAIHVLVGCHDNVIEDNFHEGRVEVVEPSNRVSGNWKL